MFYYPTMGILTGTIRINHGTIQNNDKAGSNKSRIALNEDYKIDHCYRYNRHTIVFRFPGNRKII